jgi:hypothetical protein
MPERRSDLRTLREVAVRSFFDAELTGGLMSRSLPARMLCLARIVAKGIYPEELVQHACLAFAPGSYLRYKRRKLRTRGNAGVA